MFFSDLRGYCMDDLVNEVQRLEFLLLRCALRCRVFFFKQKTAYEMRISDWSSDVCSSDLFFDTAVNRFLVDEGGLDIHAAPCIGLVVESMCRYHAAISYPEAIEAGLRVGRLGRSSVRYEIGIFRTGEDAAAADGHFVHVFVDRATNRPHPIPERIRAALERLKV